MSAFTMPIQDRELPGPFVWEPTQADRQQALSNHNQTLERLAQRGGMSWSEMAAIVLNKRWRSMPKPYAKEVCRAVLLNREAFGVNVRPAESGAGVRAISEQGNPATDETSSNPIPNTKTEGV